MSFMMHREDVSLVCLLSTEEKKCIDLNPNTQIKKRERHWSEEYFYNPLTQKQRARCRFDILNLHLEKAPPRRESRRRRRPVFALI